MLKDYSYLTSGIDQLPLGQVRQIDTGDYHQNGCRPFQRWCNESKRFFSCWMP